MILQLCTECLTDAATFVLSAQLERPGRKFFRCPTHFGMDFIEQLV